MKNMNIPFSITCNFLEECGIKLFLPVYCNLEYREMIVKILPLYSNGNMLAQKFELRSDNCVSWYLTGILLKFKNKIVVLCFSKGSIWFRMYKSKS